MSTMEAHLKANQNLTGSANDGGLGYMVYTVPEGQEFIGINGKVNPQATLGRRLVYEGQEYYVRPDDWTDAAFRTSLRQEYNISIAGSGDKLRSMLRSDTSTTKVSPTIRTWIASRPV